MNERRLFRIADSTETIELEELENEVIHKYTRNQISTPDYLKTKNEKLIYKFNRILRLLHEELTTIDEYKSELMNEMKRFITEPINQENFSIQQIIFLQNEMKISRNENLLKYIENLKVILNKLETINEKSVQYHFLFSKLDHLYEIFLNTYQINLPIKTNIETIRMALNNIRKRTKKELEEFNRIQIDFQRKLEVLKKKDELKQRTKITKVNRSINDVTSIRSF